MGFYLETERLILREMTADDAQIMFDMNNDPEVIRYTGDGPFASVEATRDFLANYYARQKPGTGRWGIEEKATGELIGWAGIKYEEDSGAYDVGYRLMRSHWGRGVATEAARACIAYAFEQLHVKEIIGRVMHDNIASIRVLEKLGLRYLHEDRCQDHPTMVYVCNRKDYDAHIPNSLTP